MKNIFPFFLCGVIISTLSFGQNSCSKYYPFVEGKTFQITSYDKKGKKATVVDYNITNVTNNTATFNTIIYDDKGKEVTTTSYNIACENDAISIDFNSLISPELLEQYKDMELDVTGTNIEIPNNLTVGQSLKDADMIMTIKMGGLNMNMTMQLTDRKVDARESVTTSAGTFNCYVISYTTQVKMGLSQTYMAKDWIAEGVGMVKSESFNKKGKLLGYSELTQVSN
jgi:hypothetical protein